MTAADRAPAERAAMEGGTTITPPAMLLWPTPLPAALPSGIVTDARGVATIPLSPVAAPAAVTPNDTVPNEEALRRSALAHQARIDAIADSVIRTIYPELTRRPAGSPAFLALVLDDRDRLMRHAVSYDPALPNDLAAIMLKIGIDTISARTLGLGISADNPWKVTVGHAVEALGPVRGHSEYRAWIDTPGSLRRVPYEHIVDSLTRARTPEAYAEHDGTLAIAVLLRDDGQLLKYLTGHNAPSSAQENVERALRRMAGDSVPFVMSGVMARLVPSKTVILWGVRR
jgi:hypothetical protein